MHEKITSTGISVVYEPPSGLPIVDIVFVHGLHGHPYKSWTSTQSEGSTSGSPNPVSREGNGLRHAVTSLSWKSGKSVSEQGERNVQDDSNGGNVALNPVFWPGDLLPKDCPDARVLVFGYDSKITKYLSGPTNKGTLLAHGKDLLFSFTRERTLNRPLIFVAHSLGGIVVKEALANSSISTNVESKNVVESTAAVLFLGTPHRGSPDLAALGEYVRTIISTFRIETTPALLDALGLKTTDLERAQESFSALWENHDFQVKTFQEGLPMVKLGFGGHATKVVHDYSSSLGDHRERAETLQANHKELCRYSGENDPNYRKVSGEIRSIYSSILRLNAEKLYNQGPEQQSLVASNPPSIEQLRNLTRDDQVLTDAQLTFLQSLWFPGLHARHRNIETSAGKTCAWLFEHELYQDWFHERNRDATFGLLWIKGKPGSGKSVLMKEAFHSALDRLDGSQSLAAGFFFNAKGAELEHSTIGLWRHLLYQLLLKDPDTLSHVSNAWYQRNHYHGQRDWKEDDLKSIFRKAFTGNQPKSLFIFIDALDECGDASDMRRLAYFWRETTIEAYDNGVRLNVCLSSRHFPSVALSKCPSVVVEDHNQSDISTYVDRKFKLGVAAEEQRWELLRDRILQKSAGVFLWAVLVVDEILTDWEKGKDVKTLLKGIEVVPTALENLYAEMLSSLEPEVRQVTMRLFQWGILSTKPLRLYEWRHIMGFIRKPTPASLAEWRGSDHFIENDDQLERQIRTLSKGLLEVNRERVGDNQVKTSDGISIIAGAGSLDNEAGDTRNVQVIHESVRDFFLNGHGFKILDPARNLDPIGNGHISIMNTCLDYLEIKELDALVEARAHVRNGRTLMQESRSGKQRTGSPISQGPRAHFTDYSGNPDEGLQETTDTAVFELLAGIPDPDVTTNVTQWMEVNHTAASDSPSLASVRNSAIYSSVSGRSQLLEDFPALLSYATHEVFSHALKAQSTQADPSALILRLENPRTWARLVTLREDFPHSSRIYDIARNCGLHSWLRVLGLGHNLASPVPELPCGRAKPARRHRAQGSVASFASAGSHSESAFHSSQGAYSYASDILASSEHGNGSGDSGQGLIRDTTLRPEPGTEADFQVDDNPFGFSPGQLNKLLNPKNLGAFEALNGPKGIVRGLQSDLHTGLSFDETNVPKYVSFDYAVSSEPKLWPDPAQRPPVRSAEQFEDRIRVFGRNILPKKKPTALWKIMLRSLNDKLIVAMIMVGVIALALGVIEDVRFQRTGLPALANWPDKVTILAALVIEMTVTSLFEWCREMTFLKLDVFGTGHQIRVVRSGKFAFIKESNVLVGDIIYLQPGDIVSADGICVWSSGLVCDESSATGESDPCMKSAGEDVMKALHERTDLRNMDPFIISGSKVINGSGTYISTAVGTHSGFGKIKMATRKDDFVPLEGLLSKSAWQLAKLGLFLGMVLFFTLLGRFLARLPSDTRPARQKAASFIDLLLVALTLVFLAIPESFLLVVQFTVTFALRRMPKKNILVRTPRAFDTIASVTTICTNVNGTLTLPRMAEVVAGRFDSLLLSKTRSSNEETLFSHWGTDNQVPLKEILVQSIVINSSAFEGEEDGRLAFLGSKMEVALLQFAKDLLGLQSLAEARANEEIIEELFSSQSGQWRGTVVRLHRKGFRLFITGAIEMLFPLCSAKVDSDLQRTPLDHADRLSFTETINEYSTRLLRTVGLGYIDFEQWPPANARSKQGETDLSIILYDLTLIGVIGITSSIRSEVPEAVLKAQRAGIDVKLVTEDNITTARGIGAECGIFLDGIIMEGHQFRTLSEDEMQDILPRLKVLARASAEDRRILVEQLHKTGQTVALVNDNVSNLDALKATDVRITGDTSGSAMAKDSSDVTLLNDSFSTVVEAVKWGRAVHYAVRRLIQFQMAGTVAAVLITFITAVSDEHLRPVMRPAQLLWIYLVLNVFAIPALAARLPTDKILDRPPITQFQVPTFMLKMILGQTLYQVAVTLVLYFAGDRILNSLLSDTEPRLELHTIVFNTFVWMQVFNQLNSRSLDNHFNIFEDIFRDPSFIVITSFVAGLQVIIIFFGSYPFQVMPGGLGGPQWAICIVTGLLCLVWGALVRVVPDSWCSPLVRGASIVSSGCGSVWSSFMAKIRKAEDTGDQGSVTTA